jgi:hypothetical protein
MAIVKEDEDEDGEVDSAQIFFRSFVPLATTSSLQYLLPSYSRSIIESTSRLSIRRKGA